jgi:hypothetical protein
MMVLPLLMMVASSQEQTTGNGWPGYASGTIHCGRSRHVQMRRIRHQEERPNVTFHANVVYCQVDAWGHGQHHWVSSFVPADRSEQRLVLKSLGIPTPRKGDVSCPASEFIYILVLCCSCVSFIASDRNVNEFICYSL